MKLTATQQRIYDELLREVNKARECKDYDEYWDKYCASRINPNYKAEFKGEYENALFGIVSIYKAKHESLKKLETLGLIKIIDIELNLIQLIEK